MIAITRYDILLTWSFIMFTWWQAGQLLSPNRDGCVGKSFLLNISNGHPHVPWVGVIFKNLTGKRSFNNWFHMQIHVHRERPPLAAILKVKTKDNHHIGKLQYCSLKLLKLLRDPHWSWSFLSQSMLGSSSMLVEGRRGESRLLLQAGGLLRKRRLMTYLLLRQ